ncbi:DoxX family protein [Aquamicrobium terrae]|uniref:Xanthine/uracil/vitamin C permease (AzgA family) n=1 Tax=Aquamicrobium terrae TaxID=1324945 RepID=A0ABV2MXC0_9HYPH
MNIVLWVLQILLAVHTAIGAVWKFSNPAQTMPSLSAIPPGVWLGMSVVELLCSLGLVLPAFHRPLAYLVPVAALFVAAEMLVFCALHIASGDGTYGPLIYWVVVAALCAFIAYGRLTLRPL